MSIKKWKWEVNVTIQYNILHSYPELHWLSVGSLKVHVATVLLELTDLTLCPMPRMSLCSFLMLFTNSIGIMPESYAWENCFAAPSRAPPKRSPCIRNQKKINSCHFSHQTKHQQSFNNGFVYGHSWFLDKGLFSNNEASKGSD